MQFRVAMGERRVTLKHWFLFVQSFLLSLLVRDTCSLKCTMDNPTLNPCRCVLSGEYSGVVDLNYVFKDGAINSKSQHFNYYALVHPCGTGPNKVNYLSSSRLVRYYGNAANISMDWTVSQFVPEDDKFEFVVEYSGSDLFTPLEITYTYDSGQDHKVSISNYNQVYKNAKTTLQVKVASRYVKPVFTQNPGPDSPYPLLQDVCNNWKRRDSLLYQTELVNLAATVNILNDSFSLSSPAYYLGICHSPVSSSSVLDGTNCFAVQRKPTFNTQVDLCLGRRLGATLLDRRDQGWMLLTYPHGDFVPSCKGYVVTEVYLTCAQDQNLQNSPALYPENTFTDVCRYQFIWPTHLACPNATSSSQNPAYFRPYYILLGLSSAVAAVLLVVLIGLCIAACLFWRSGKDQAKTTFELK